MCAYRPWALKLYELLKKSSPNFELISSPKQLTLKNIKKINPKFIFFPDWSWIISDNIINQFTCICFHESDLPKFRGGSPIQNQIIRGIEKTKTSAFIMNDVLDGGDILLKRNLSLEGTINDIFDRMIKNDYYMIKKIINSKLTPRKQKGKPTFYKRRSPLESELPHLKYSKKHIYDFIRMLSDPYPNAFIKINNKKIIFKSAKYKNNKLEFIGEMI